MRRWLVLVQILRAKSFGVGRPVISSSPTAFRLLLAGCGLLAGSRLLTGLGLLALATLAGCGHTTAAKKDDTPPAIKRTVRVAAAPDMRYPLAEGIAQFNTMHPEIDVQFTYGPSAQFFRELSKRAPYDLFLSASLDYPHRLIDSGMGVRDSVFGMGDGRLVLWVPQSTKLDLEKLDFNQRGIDALADPSIQKIAVADTLQAAYGRAAQSALSKHGLLEKVRDRLVVNDDVDDVLAAVESGEAQVGLLPLSMAISLASKELGRYWALPANDYPPIDESGCIMVWAKDREATEILHAYLRGTQFRRILGTYGYTLGRD